MFYVSYSMFSSVVLKSTVAVTAGLLLAACAAPSGNGSGQAASAGSRVAAQTGEQETGTVSRPDEVVCVSEHVIGSRLPQRTCRTRAEWEASRISARETMRDLQASPTTLEDD